MSSFTCNSILAVSLVFLARLLMTIFEPVNEDFPDVLQSPR